jgi:hypothetical protein
MTSILSSLAFFLLDLEAYRWKSRVLLNFGEPIKLSAKIQSAFKERDLVLLQATSPELRKAFQVESSFALILIGKDGGEKARWLTPVDPQTIANLIDTMPMRQSEMRRHHK